jgi:multiple sugar transport system permease protein
MSTAVTPAQRPMTAPETTRRRRMRPHLAGWGFALPWVVLFAVFLAGPILASFLLSFTDFGLKDLRNPIGTNLIGLDNYAALAGDEEFRSAAFNTTYFVLVGVPLTLLAGLASALLLNSTAIRLKALFRVGYYTPVVTSIVAIAVIWRYVLHPDFGLLNLGLAALGISGPNWLASTTWAMPSIIAIAVWRNVGYTMVIFLAGLQGVPETLYEAARIDGASRWQEFRHITLPLLRPTTLFAAVITSIGYLNLMEEPFVMTNGGPLNSTLSMAMHLYREGFNFLHFGYASAIGYALFAAIVALTVVHFRLLRSQT